MSDLNPFQKEDIARLWCSKENNMELRKEIVLFWDDAGKMYPFEFDIASHPQRKEIKELQEKLKKYEEVHGKIKDRWNDQYFKEHFVKVMGLYAQSPDTPDNREVIGMVKSGKHDSGGNTFRSILGDCFLLTRAKADKKYMFLTDIEMHSYFQKRCNGILDEIELVYLNVDEHEYLLKNV